MNVITTYIECNLNKEKLLREQLRAYDVSTGSTEMACGHIEVSESN